jgi:hypothetical protein
MPQGFGFEARKGDRRQTGDRRDDDRREPQDRRLGDRRRRAVAVTVERRLSGDRRAKVRRSLSRRLNLRRVLADRRNTQFRESDGLRITQHGFRFRPSTFGMPGQVPPSTN